MNFNQFNFEHSAWLWALMLVPIMWLIFMLKKSAITKKFRLERFADTHLLPYLVKNTESKNGRPKKSLYLWSFIWTLGVLSVSGPRWDFRELNTFKSNKNLVILLDLASSMDAKDIKPSRLIRARQKIQDILDSSPDVNIGLIAFAEDAHLITPITEDKGAIKYLLSALRTDLVYVPGNRLSPALVMADHLLSATSGKDKSILVMSDGNFEDSSSVNTVKTLASHGIKISTMGFGTLDGVPKLNQDQLQYISKLGDGLYLNAMDPIDGRDSFFNRLSSVGGSFEHSTQTTIDWEPRFYVFLIPMLLLLLPFFRRRQVIVKKRSMKNVAAVLIVTFVVLPHIARAGETKSADKKTSTNVLQLFKNENNQGKEAFDAQEYETAIEKFNDPYRKGVAQYKAGQLDKAEQSFRGSLRPEVKIDSEYNLGNALALQEKYEDAIKAYERVLKEQPDHQHAKINLKIVQDLLKKKEQEQKKSGDQNKNQAQSKDQKKGGKEDKREGQDQKKERGQGNEHGKSSDQVGNKDQKQNGKQGQGEGPNQNKEQGKDKEQGKSNDQEANQGLDQKKEKGHGIGPDQAQDRLENQSKAHSSEKPNGEVHDFSQKQYDQKVARKNQQDIDADQWLNRLTSDPHAFLKNQFLIESSRSQSQKGDQQ